MDTLAIVVLAAADDVAAAIAVVDGEAAVAAVRSMELASTLGLPVFVVVQPIDVEDYLIAAVQTSVAAVLAAADASFPHARPVPSLICGGVEPPVLLPPLYLKDIPCLYL